MGKHSIMHLPSASPVAPSSTFLPPSSSRSKLSRTLWLFNIEPSNLDTAEVTLESFVCSSFDAGYSSRVDSLLVEELDEPRGEVGGG